MKVAIIGATGYGGVELVRFLNNHPSVSIHSIHATSLHGEPLANSYPHMETIIHDRLEAVDIDNIAREVDIVFTATPSGVSAKLAPALIQKGIKVIDLSGDFRVTNPDIYQQWYGLEPAEDSMVKQAVYG